jgi:hypothetical protein
MPVGRDRRTSPATEPSCAADCGTRRWRRSLGAARRTARPQALSVASDRPDGEFPRALRPNIFRGDHSQCGTWPRVPAIGRRDRLGSGFPRNEPLAEIRLRSLAAVLIADAPSRVVRAGGPFRRQARERCRAPGASRSAGPDTHRQFGAPGSGLDLRADWRDRGGASPVACWDRERGSWALSSRAAEATEALPHRQAHQMVTDLVRDQEVASAPLRAIVQACLDQVPLAFDHEFLGLMHVGEVVADLIRDGLLKTRASPVGC